jgi:hypothetical protein
VNYRNSIPADRASARPALTRQAEWVLSTPLTMVCNRPGRYGVLEVLLPMIELIDSSQMLLVGLLRTSMPSDEALTLVHAVADGEANDPRLVAYQVLADELRADNELLGRLRRRLDEIETTDTATCLGLLRTEDELLVEVWKRKYVEGLFIVHHSRTSGERPAVSRPTRADLALAVEVCGTDRGRWPCSAPEHEAVARALLGLRLHW